MKRNENCSNDFPAAGTLGAQPQGKENDSEESHCETAEQIQCSAAEIDEQDIHHTEGVPWEIIVIGVAAIVPHNAKADSLMEGISLFVEENTEAEIIDEVREIR